MKAKTVVIIMGLIVLFIAGTLFLTKKSMVQDSASGSLVFPDLMAQVNEVTQILVSANSGSMTISREEEIWKVKEKSGYRADMEKVRKTVIGLAELKIIEPKTKTPELHEKLGLRDIEEEGSVSTNISLKREDGTAIAEILVGNRRPSKGAAGKEEFYIRKPNDPQTWLALGNLLVERLPEEWLDKTILDLPAKRVHRVQITHPDKSVLTLVKEKTEGTDFTIVGMPRKMKVKSQFTVNNIATTLGGLALDGVQPATEQSLDESKIVKAVLETVDGLQATVLLQKTEDKTFVTVTSRFDETLVQQPPETIEAKKSEEKSDPDHVESEGKTESETKTPEPQKMKSAEEVQTEVAELNQRVEGWVYSIPKFRADNITKKMKDLIEKKS